MEITYNETITTEHQLALAARVEEFLRTSARYQRDVVQSRGNGPAVEFVIATQSSELSVTLELYQDSFHIHANGAEVIIELVRPENPGNYDRWAADVYEAAKALFSPTLRLRLRRSMFGAHKTGAIYFARGSGGSWSGDLLSALGIGRQVTFQNWYKPAGGVNGFENV